MVTLIHRDDRCLFKLSRDQQWHSKDEVCTDAMQGNGWKGEHCLTVFPSLHSGGSLDDTHGILQLLRTRSQGAAGAELPQLGALLGRGSYGKVYKGKDPSLYVTVLAPGLYSFHRSNADASVDPHLMRHGHSGSPAKSACRAGLASGPGNGPMDQAPLISKCQTAPCIDRCRAQVACAGRWNGAMVAVKIIQHSADIKSKIEAFRETLVSANIHHPNVVSTYKIITCEQHGMRSGQQPGRLSSALGSYSECPAHGMGQELQPALMGKSCIGLETLQA